MAVVNGTRPTQNTDGSPSGNTTPQAEILDASGVAIVGPIGGPSGVQGQPYSIVMPLTVAQAAAAVKAQTWVNGAGGSSAKVDLGAPAGGFTPSLPNPPSNTSVTN